MRSLQATFGRVRDGDGRVEEEGTRGGGKENIYILFPGSSPDLPHVPGENKSKTTRKKKKI